MFWMNKNSFKYFNIYFPKPLSIGHCVKYKHNYNMLKIHASNIHILAKFFTMLKSSNKFCF